MLNKLYHLQKICQEVSPFLLHFVIICDTFIAERVTNMNEILKQIDYAIQYIWENDIKKDYDNYYLLKEDCLKNALYFHLRTKLSSFLEKNNLRIFTEFNDSVFKGANRRADMVIAKIDPDLPEAYLSDCVTEIICVIEIKNKNGTTASAESIYKDYEKIKWYINNLNTNCHYYMATIWEQTDKATTWTRKNAAWAKNRLTELNASYEKDEMRFYISKH